MIYQSFILDHLLSFFKKKKKKNKKKKKFNLI
nr:hypothetical protein RF1 [Medicago coronata]